MRILVGAALAAMLAAGAAGAQQLGGAYTVAGTNFDGTPYTGTATITYTTSTSCRIIWLTGSTTSEGICMANGDAFAAGYTFNSGQVGLAVYRVMPDGTLQGTWTVTDTEGAGTEVLTPAR